MGHLVAPAAAWGAFLSQSVCLGPPEPGAPGAAMAAVAIARGGSLWAPFWSRACREDGPKSQLLRSLSLGTFGRLAAVAHALSCCLS